MINELEKLAGQLTKEASSEHLQILAKRAAGDYIQKKADSLTSAVQSVIQGEGLNKDQIRRVSEMANQSAWKNLFNEDNTTVSFDPSDADKILSSLDESVTVKHDDNIDYYSDPGERKEEHNLEEIFKTEDTSDLPPLNPTAEIEEGHQKAASVQDLARYSLDSLGMAMQTVSEDFYNMVKQAHVRDGFGVLQIAKAVGDTVESEKFASSIMHSVSGRLKSEGVQIKIAEEVKKAKERVVVNSEHPILAAASKLEKLASAYIKAEKMHKEASEDKRNFQNRLLKSMSK